MFVCDLLHQRQVVLPLALPAALLDHVRLYGERSGAQGLMPRSEGGDEMRGDRARAAGGDRQFVAFRRDLPADER